MCELQNSKSCQNDDSFYISESKIEAQVGLDVSQGRRNIGPRTLALNKTAKKNIKNQTAKLSTSPLRYVGRPILNLT